MDTDLSIELLKKYHSLGDHRIEVKMKNGNLLHGVLAGFYRSDDMDHTASISHLHLIPEDDHSVTGEDAFGLANGSVIHYKEIKQIKFSDHSIMLFK